MINKKYKTIYSSIVPKGSIGTCVDVEVGVVLAFRLEFENGAYIDAFFEEIDEIDSVVFVDGCFKLKRTGFDVCICRSVEDFKVIGNIYENPELLEVES